MTDVARTLILTEILSERQRQIAQEGYTPEHDNIYDEGQLAEAVAAYALTAAGIPGADSFWPFPVHCFRPTTPRRDLIKAAALIMAEIERIDGDGIDVARDG